MAKSKLKKPPKTPPPQKPWDVLPIEGNGDSSPEALFQSVGIAMTVWERLDHLQSVLFSEIVSSRQSAANAAFGTVQSASGCAQMVNAAAEQLFAPSDPLLAEIKDNIGKIGELSGRRNDIAHGMVSSFTTTNTGSDGAVHKPAHGFYLVPKYSNIRKRLSKK